MEKLVTTLNKIQVCKIWFKFSRQTRLNKTEILGNTKTIIKKL